LQPIQTEDAKALFKYRSQRAHHPYQGWIPEKMVAAVQYIQKMPLKFNQNDSWFPLVIELNGQEGLLGDIGIHFINEKRGHCELGISLDVKFRGKGYASEALAAVIDKLQADFNKSLITVSIDPQNQPSLKLFKRLGFTQDAEFDRLHPIHPEFPHDVILGRKLRPAEARRPGKG
jgi:RimJ/RimL family protein N-acetyltransferase